MLLEIHSNQDNDNIKESSLLTKHTCSKSEQVLQGVIQTLNILTLITYLKYTKFPKMSANKQDEQNSFSSLVDQNKRRRLNEKDNYDFDNDDNRIEQEKQHLPIEISNSEGALVSDYQKSDFFEGIMDSDQKPENGKVEEQNEERRTSNELSLGEAFAIKSKNEIDCNKDVNEASLNLKEKSNKYTDNYNGGIREDCNSSTRNTIDESFSSKINESTNENSKECMENKNNIRNSPDQQQPENLCETQGGGYYPQYTQAPNIGYSETIGVQSKEAYSHTENDDNLLKNSNPSLNAINVSDGSDRTQHNINPGNRKEGSNHELEINSSYSNSEGNCFEQNLPKTNDMIPLWAPHEEFKYIHKPELNNFRHSSNQKAEDLQTNSSLPLYKPHHQPERQSPNVDMNALDINRYINQQAGFSQQEPAQLQSPNHFIHDPNVFNQIIHNPNDQLQTQNELINNPQRLQNRDLYLESHHQYTQEQYFKNPTNQHHNINVFNDMQSQLQIHGHLPPHNSEENKLEMNAPHISSYGTHSATEHIRIPQHSSQQDSMQIANNYHHLMIDEFHEDPNTTYKLTLSPAVKHENQDDGYETSAGDVLTPNSHTSSTHSVTPQQQGQLSTSSNPKQKQDEHQVPSHQDEHTHTQIQGTIRTGEMFFDQRHSQNFNPESSSPSEITNQLQPSSDIVETETNFQQQSLPEGIPPLPEPKRRGRKKKIVDPTLIPNSTLVGNPATGTKNKERKKHDRFNGMSEEEVSQRHLPDHLCDNLDIVIIGINPGLFAAYKGHHYAGPGNHFWKCLYLAGLTPEQMSSEEDYKLINSGIGFTNMVQRPTKGSADLTRKEIKEGSRILLEKIQKFRPKIAVFNGKLIFEVFSGKKDFNFGRQPECVEGTNTYIWVMPSSSARCAQLPRAADKVPFYFALKKFRDFLNGVISHMDESECVFTEERIREICPQEKSLQNANSNPDSSSPNSANDLQSSGTNFGTTPFPEKKKRGRPKKIKEPLVIDPSTGNIIGNTQQTKAEESNGILNLSVLENIVPGKKKRGRPKKVKPIFEMNPSQNPNISRSGESLAAHSPQTTYHQHGSYEDQASNIKQQQQQQQMYNKISPSLNCTFRITTPPTSNQQTALDNPKSEHINASNVCLPNKNPDEDCSAAAIMQRNNQMSSRIEPQLGESPPPSSPNICTDFEPPSGTASRQVDTDVKRRELNLESQQIHLQERSRYSSPSQDHMTEQHSDNFQQWMSPQNQSLQQQSAAQYSVQHSEHISHLPNHLHYQTENHQVENAQIQNDQWQRNQSFGETSNNYMMTQRHHQIRQEQDQGQGSKASTQLSSDVARKSLSGLESLVDQIPTVSDNEPGCSSGPTAAAIALENRLHDLQCQQNSNQHSSNVSSPNESFAACANRSTGSSITDAPRRSTNSLHNSNFSVSNLAESAVSPNTSNPVFGSNTAINSSGNPYRPNIISAAALAAVSSNPNSSSAHHVPHGPQLYIDPHAHISHVSSNSMYVPQTHHHSSSHHQHHTLAHHHHPAHHHHAYAASTGSVPSAPDYSIPYGLPTQTSTFHMPSPNYPYGYGSPSAQTNYASYMHSHHAHHAHSAHHLSMFERLKPSDIGSYGGF